MPRSRRSPSSRPSCLLLVACSIVLFAAPLVAQQGAARAALDTWIERVNEASDEELQEYVAGSFLQQVPLEQMMTVHRQIRDAAPLTLEEIESETDQAVVAVLGTAAGRRLRAQLSVSGDPRASTAC